jgi:hypothetical protein
MRRALLAASLAMAVASTAVLIARTQHHVSLGPPLSPQAAFENAIGRHDYRRAYALTDLPFLKVEGAASAITLAHFTAFVRANKFGRRPQDRCPRSQSIECRRRCARNAWPAERPSQPCGHTGTSSSSSRVLTL